MQQLLEIMAALRDPDKGCPWDREQTFESIAPYTLEEAYEVADAIEQGDMRELQAELGDLLFQVAFYSQMGREQGLFDYEAIEGGICEKMRRRHPHVFGDVEVGSAAEQSEAWERHKAAERRRKGREHPHGQLDGIARALPALVRAEKLQRRAAKVGFDWPDADGVFEKLREECDELRRARASGSRAAMRDELGDLLFSAVNLARHLGLDAEQSLREANAKFERRFRGMEAVLDTRGEALGGMDMAELDAAWEQVKVDERRGG
ncbi:MAG: nucleoside triphosphate pyrophosphohydrolase [gamma proteobacterium symbiont of Phacoides pectinatus]